MFLKENSNGDIKVCACADGRKNKHTIDKEDATPPTVSTESVFVTAEVGTHEDWYVDTFDTHKKW